MKKPIVSIALIAGCITAPGSLQAQRPEPAVSSRDVVESQPVPAWADSFVVIAPGAHYARGGVSRLFVGGHYRELWTTPIRVPVLNLDRFAGGLTPLQAHTGSQTRSIRFAGADGRQYQ